MPTRPLPSTQFDPNDEAHRAWLRAFYTRLYCWYLEYVAPVVIRTAGPADADTNDVDEHQEDAPRKPTSSRPLTEAEHADLVPLLEQLGHPQLAGDSWYVHTYSGPTPVTAIFNERQADADDDTRAVRMLTTAVNQLIGSWAESSPERRQELRRTMAERNDVLFDRFRDRFSDLDRRFGHEAGL